MTKPYAIVLGLYGANAIGVVRALGADSIPVKGYHVGAKTPHAMFSKHVHESRLNGSLEELLERLVRDGEKLDEKGVLFATGDDFVLFCDQYKEELSPFYHVPVIPNASISNLLDKDVNVSLGRDAGFNVPKSGYLSEGVPDFFPVLVKPRNSIGTSKNDIRIYKSRGSLESEVELLLSEHGDMVVQSYIPGGEENYFEVHLVYTTVGPVVVAMQQHLLEEDNGLPGCFGILNKSVFIDELVRPSKKLAENLKFKGALDINLKLNDNDNEFYFLEVNFRTSANLALDNKAGLNAPAIVYRNLVGIDFEELLRKDIRIGVLFTDERRSARHYGEKDSSVSQITRDLQGVTSFAFYDPEDVGPLTAELPEIISFFKRK